MGDQDGVLSIVSTRDRTGEAGPACLISWYGQDWYAPVADVRATAWDLFLAASYGDMIAELMRIDLDKHVIQQMMTVLLQKAVEGRPKGTVPRRTNTLGSSTTIDVQPGGSSKQKAGRVLIRKGPSSGMLTPDEARTAALHWLQVAEASEHDTLTNLVLVRTGMLDEDQTDILFGLLMDIRAGKAQLPPPRPEEGGQS